MTGPHLSLAQIRNRLILTARAVLRQHRPGPDGRCPMCRTPDCPVATAARDVLRTAEEAQQHTTASELTTRDPDDPQKAG
ncbi:hypothetical protein CA850_26220 [Micromonospora echinospora]|uniref:Uncharacterized protein n=1 Tax=Micromonospora echinospora TaxID=1877 RepID=A0A1C4VMC7_MICEC|nr:hypothetical protein [Micromonospora echinospora]OZV76719.1 hypothetical protein CA850_26220 [Micromonospora echinospora]SCE85088.1 hypothetical protein GA0070618_1387 [Micromonospora echinospora]